MPDDLSTVRSRLDEDRELVHDEAAVLLREICAALLQYGISRVELEYCGSWDEMEFESPSFLPESIEVPGELEKLVLDWTGAMLPDGWDIEEGGQGTVSIAVAEATALINHEDNYIQSELRFYKIG